MDNLIKIIEFLIGIPKSSCTICKHIYVYVKKVFIKCWLIAFITIFTASFVYIGSIVYLYNKEVLIPSLLLYKNKEAINASETVNNINLIQDLALKCGLGVTISWAAIEAKNLNSFEKKLTFIAAKSSRKCNKNLCSFDSKKHNKVFWDKEYELSSEDGMLIEQDQIILTLDQKTNPLNFKELHPILIPIYNKHGLSLEMRSLQYKAPDFYRLLLNNPVPLSSMQSIAIAKVRNSSIKNKLVVFLIMASRWRDLEGSCTDEGLKKAVYIIAERIKNTMIVF